MLLLYNHIDLTNYGGIKVFTIPCYTILLSALYRIGAIWLYIMHTLQLFVQPHQIIHIIIRSMLDHSKYSMVALSICYMTQMQDVCHDINVATIQITMTQSLAYSAYKTSLDILYAHLILILIYTCFILCGIIISMSLRIIYTTHEAVTTDISSSPTLDKK